MSRASARRFGDHKTRPVPTDREIKVCSSKVKHATKQHAKTSAARSSRYGTKITVYECQVCNSWHLTAMPQELIRAARRTAP
jgi:hypothetical protein